MCRPDRIGTMPWEGALLKRQPEDAQRRSINFWVHALAGSISKSAMRYYSANFGIRLPEMRILNTLYDDGNLAARELVYLTAMDKALVSRVLAGLLEAGYVEQIEDSERIRLREWTLTEKGRQLIERLIPEWTARWKFIQKDLDDKERAALKDMLQRLFLSSEALYATELKEGRYKAGGRDQEAAAGE
jgi:DNA-binding MarR family transcriptional regulator